LYHNQVAVNQSYHFVTFGDWQLSYQLPVESLQKQLILSPMLASSANLLRLSYEIFGPQITGPLTTPQALEKSFIMGQGADEEAPKLSCCDVMLKFYTEYLSQRYGQLQLTRQYSPTALTSSEGKMVPMQAPVTTPAAAEESKRPTDSESHLARKLERSRSRSYSPSTRGSKTSNRSEENPDVAYLMFIGLQPGTSEAEIINAIAPFIRVFVRIYHSFQ
jgi:hypothetical protein